MKMQHPRAPMVRRVPMSAAVRRSMTDTVMARTVGSTCDRAASLLASRIDRPLDDSTAALLEGHLDHCTVCRELGAVMDGNRHVLASLADLDPGPGFATGVVHATTDRRPWAQRKPWLDWVWLWELGRAWSEKAGGAWQRVIARPRLSLELAYLATVIAVLLVGNPNLIAEAVGAGARPAQVAMAGSGAAGASSVASNQGASGAQSPAWIEQARREVAAGQSAISRGWDWFAGRVSTLVRASWDWLVSVVRWLDLQISGPAPTEPAKPPVRDSK